MNGKTFLKKQEDIDFVKAKQRASIKWLLAKAYNHKTPLELKEPFYKDHDDVDRLKPHVVRGMANAEIYCLALSNLYSDPNFHNLNHCGIMQALGRKGISIVEPPDCALTETMLIQTNPLKLSAHMAVIESLMQLFIKELVSIDRVMSTVLRFSTPNMGNEVPTTQEEALLFWVNKCAEGLIKRTGGEVSPSFNFVKLRELSDLKNGFGLATLLSFYCPEVISWDNIAGVTDGSTASLSISDSLFNLQLVQQFCRDALPFNVCHMCLEDFVYMDESFKTNLVCFLTDLFHGLEVRPVTEYVQLPGVRKDQVIEVPDPDLHRPSSLKRLSSASQDRSGKPVAPTTPPREEPFIIQRGRGVATLKTVTSSPNHSMYETDKNLKERQNQDTKSEERGETDFQGNPSSLIQQSKNIPMAGRPSDTTRRSSIAGRRSRRNSTEDSNASQLSVENLGGSRENLSMLSRNPDKEMRTHSGKKTFNNDRFIDNRELEEMEKHQLEDSSYSDKSSVLERGTSASPDQTVSFADFRKQKARDQFHTSAINITYTEHEKEDISKRLSMLQGRNGSKEPSSATLTDQDLERNDSADAMVTQVHSIQLKLEQRRRRIEEEKRKMEMVKARQREKVGQEAFIRAVIKGPTKRDSSLDADRSDRSKNEILDQIKKQQVPKRPFNLQDVSDDITAVESRWLNDRAKSQASTGPRTPDIEAMDMETYTQSITAMNDSLYDLQSDMQRLAQQQSQIQRMMSTPRVDHSHMPHNPMDPQPFFIASPDPLTTTPQRRTWGQPQPISFAQQPIVEASGGWQGVQRRQQWGGHHNQQQRPITYYGGNQFGDHFGNPVRDQWGNPAMAHVNSPYNGQYPDQPYGYTNPMYGGGYNYNGTSPIPQGPSPSSPYCQAEIPSSRTPFRLHENSSPSSPLLNSNSPSSSSTQRNVGSSLASPDGYQVQYPRQNQRDSISSSKDSPVYYNTHRTHSGMPAPGEDEMAPQNVSFIDTAEKDISRNSKLSDRISQLNISSGSKTYRVHSADKESSTSPSPTRARPSISSAFKQQRKSSGGENTINSSLRSLTSQGLTEEEAEALSAIKTEKLKEDSDASKGFVICFDDNGPKKPKPQLKPRRVSSKKNSLVSEISSDASSSSRKENVPPEVMICIDMNMGDEGSDGCGNSPFRGKFQSRNGIRGPGSWRSCSESENQISNSDNDGSIFPKFDIDPDIPLETMATLLGSESESDGGKTSTGLIIGEGLLHVDPNTQEEMQRKKEKIMMLSLRRKQQTEENRQRKDEELRLKREEESRSAEEKLRKKEEEKARREAILHQFKMKKELEKDDEDQVPEPISARPVPKLRPKSAAKIMNRPRPKTIHVDQGADVADTLLSRGPRGSTSNLSVISNSNGTLRRSESRNSVSRGPTNVHTSSISLAAMGTGRALASRQQPVSRSSSRHGSMAYLDDHADESRLQGNRMLKSSRESLQSGATFSARRGSNASVYDGPGSLPGYARRRLGPGGEYDDGASDISSTSGFSAYGYRSGTRLYREPASKSNRSIILNAIEYVVFPGVVNAETRNRVLDVIDRCDCPHFLLLFRDVKCQFRGLYAYYPDTEEVYKIHGVGPKQVVDNMFETFFKYNSGGKKFTKIHTKHLTVTIDAFTIHNSLWLGKKAKLPDKRDMALVV